MVDRATFTYDTKDDKGSVTQVTKDISLVNMIATKVPKLGEDHPIDPGLPRPCTLGASGLPRPCALGASGLPRPCTLGASGLPRPCALGAY